MSTEFKMTERRDKTSSAMNAMTGSLDHLDNQRNAATLFADPNGNGRTTSQTSRGQLVHSVSIIVEPVLDDLDPSLEEEGKDHLQDRGEKESFLPNKDLRSLITTSDTTSFDSSQQRLLRKERIHSSPIIVLDDHFFGKKTNTIIA
jgi:hypothetical protein